MAGESYILGHRPPSVDRIGSVSVAGVTVCVDAADPDLTTTPSHYLRDSLKRPDILRSHRRPSDAELNFGMAIAAAGDVPLDKTATVVAPPGNSSGSKIGHESTANSGLAPPGPQAVGGITVSDSHHRRLGHHGDPATAELTPQKFLQDAAVSDAEAIVGGLPWLRDPRLFQSVGIDRVSGNAPMVVRSPATTIGGCGSSGLGSSLQPSRMASIGPGIPHHHTPVAELDTGNGAGTSSDVSTFSPASAAPNRRTSMLGQSSVVVTSSAGGGGDGGATVFAMDGGVAIFGGGAAGCASDLTSEGGGGGLSTGMQCTLGGRTHISLDAHGSGSMPWGEQQPQDNGGGVSPAMSSGIRRPSTSGVVVVLPPRSAAGLVPNSRIPSGRVGASDSAAGTAASHPHSTAADSASIAEGVPDVLLGPDADGVDPGDCTRLEALIRARALAHHMKRHMNAARRREKAKFALASALRDVQQQIGGDTRNHPGFAATPTAGTSAPTAEATNGDGKALSARLSKASPAPSVQGCVGKASPPPHTQDAKPPKTAPSSSGNPPPPTTKKNPGKPTFLTPLAPDQMAPAASTGKNEEPFVISPFKLAKAQLSQLPPELAAKVTATVQQIVRTSASFGHQEELTANSNGEYGCEGLPGSTCAARKSAADLSALDAAIDRSASAHLSNPPTVPQPPPSRPSYSSSKKKRDHAVPTNAVAAPAVAIPSLFGAPSAGNFDPDAASAGEEEGGNVEGQVDAIRIHIEFTAAAARACGLRPKFSAPRLGTIEAAAAAVNLLGTPSGGTRPQQQRPSSNSTTARPAVDGSSSGGANKGGIMYYAAPMDEFVAFAPMPAGMAPPPSRERLLLAGGGLTPKSGAGVGGVGLGGGGGSRLPTPGSTPNAQRGGGRCNLPPVSAAGANFHLPPMGSSFSMDGFEPVAPSFNGAGRGEQSSRGSVGVVSSGGAALVGGFAPRGAPSAPSTATHQQQPSPSSFLASPLQHQFIQQQQPVGVPMPSLAAARPSSQQRPTFSVRFTVPVDATLKRILQRLMRYVEAVPSAGIEPDDVVDDAGLPTRVRFKSRDADGDWIPVESKKDWSLLRTHHLVDPRTRLQPLTLVAGCAPV
jgi:hypothetical protein